MRKVIVTEQQLNVLGNSLQMTEHKFFIGLKNFIGQLLADPVNAKPNDFFCDCGLERTILVNHLLDSGIITKKGRISDKDLDGNPKRATMIVRFKCPKEGFEDKIKTLFTTLFPEDLNEDGGCMGAVSAASSGAFASPQALGGVIVRRKITR